MAEFKSLKYFLTKLPTTPAHIYREVYTDLFALFNSFRKLLSDLDEALLDYLTDAPEDGKTYGRKDGEWTEVTGGGGSGVVETVVAGTGISVDDTDPANPVVSSTVNPFVEAPEDGELYGRKDAAWELIPTASVDWGDLGGTLSDQTDLAAALSGKEPSITAGTAAQYWRGDKTWQDLPSPGISDAPADSKTYGRKDNSWVEIVAGTDIYTALKDILIAGTGMSFTWDDVNKTVTLDTSLTPVRTEFSGTITWAQVSTYSGVTSANATNMRDNDTSTGTGTNGTTNQWVRADLGSAVTITAVKIGAGTIPSWGTVSSYLNGAMLQSASAAIGPWTSQATISGLDDTSNLIKEFVLSVPVSARYWRLLNTSNYLAVTEFRFYID